MSRSKSDINAATVSERERDDVDERHRSQAGSPQELISETNPPVSLGEQTVVEVPSPAAVAFITTEHFTLQGARSATISESIGRASMFLASLTGGLVALGLLSTSTHVGTAFYAFGLILLPTCAVLGVVTYQRTLQSGIEDLGYARRIAHLRSYYFDAAPELVPYLASVAPPDRLRIEGLAGGRWQKFRTVAGTVGVITAVIAGSAAGLAVAAACSHTLPASIAAGGAVGLSVLTALIRYQASVWRSAMKTNLFPEPSPDVADRVADPALRAP